MALTIGHIPGKPAVGTIEYQFARQAVDLILTTVDPAINATDLFVPLEVGTWAVKAYAMHLDGAASTDGYRSNYTFSGTVTLLSRNDVIHNLTAISLTDVARFTDLTSDVIVAGIADNRFVQVDRLTLNVTAAGNLRFRAAKRFDVGADTVFQAGSYLIARKKI